MTALPAIAENGVGQMAALRPVAGVVRVTCTGTANGMQIVNVFHVRGGPGALSAGEVAVVTTAVGTAYQTHMVPGINSAYSGGSLYGVDLTSEDGADASGSIGGTGAGAGTQVPNSACVCITWKIARHYRGGHPRTYLGPIPATAIESPTSLTSTYVTARRTAANNFLAAINGTTVGTGTAQLVAVHRYRDKLQLTTPLTSPIETAVIDDRIDTQRRRLGKDR